MRRPVPARLVPAALVLLAAACSGDSSTGPAAGTPARVEALSGSGQSGAVGAELPAPLVVRVVDTQGKPLGGIPVAWSVAAGGGSVHPATSTTDASGAADTRWTLGRSAGQNGVTAAVGSLSASFAATGAAGAVAKVEIAPDSAALRSLGDTVRFRGTLSDAYGNRVEPTGITWASSDLAVASVDGGGLVLSRGNGSARIVASSGGAADTVSVRVRQVVELLALQPSSDTVSRGDTLRLQVTARDARGNAVAAPRVEWTSSQPTVASVDSSGLVRGEDLGSASINARSDGKLGVASIVVSVTVASVRISPRSATVPVGAERRFTASVLAGSGEVLAGRRVTWASLDPGVAGVTSAGVVQGRTPGSARIRATSGGRADTVTVAVRAPVRFAQVAGGALSACALTPAGKAYCWGAGIVGQLGIADPFALPDRCSSGPCSGVPLPVAGDLTFTQISSGSGHVCALRADGTVYCWGFNNAGELGRSTEPCPPYPDSSCGLTPGPVSTSLRFRSVSAGWAHTCGLATDDRVYCWGEGGSGQLGNGDQMRSQEPVRVQSSAVFTSVSAGLEHTCAVTADGAAYCWGLNDRGQLGQETGTTRCGGKPCRTMPTRTLGTVTFRSVRAGETYSCGLDAGGKAYCWGSDNGSGALGNGHSSIATPSPVDGGHSFRTLEVGEWHNCGITEAGATLCWGWNSGGQLGNGTRTNEGAPIPVSGGHGFAAISAGDRFTCGITAQSVTYCWGFNDEAQLGSSRESVFVSPVPIQVTGQ